MDALLPDDLGLMHLLHRINLLSLLQFHAPNLPESAFADHVNAIEMLPCHLFALRLSQNLIGLFELGKVNFKAIFHILIRFLRDSRIAAIVLLLFLLGNLLAFSSTVLHLRPAGHQNPSCTVHTAFSTVKNGLPCVGGGGGLDRIWNSDGLDLWPAASLGIQKDGF